MSCLAVVSLAVGVIVKKPAFKQQYIWFVVLLTMAPISHAATKPLLPFPEGVRVVIVGENMEINGLPLMAYEFYSQQTLNQIANFYRHYWQDHQQHSDAKQAYLESHYGGWHILSRLERGHNITVQLQNSGIKGVRALVGVSPLPTYIAENKNPVVEYKIPTLSGLTIESFVQSQDRGIKTETYWIRSRDSVESTSNKLQRYYQQRGYSVSIKRGNKESSQLIDAVSLTVANTNEKIRFDTLDVDGGTRIIALRKES